MTNQPDTRPTPTPQVDVEQRATAQADGAPQVDDRAVHE